MAGIRKYEVTVPPTSDEVRLLALDAILNHTVINIHGRPEPTDIGPRDEVDLNVRIRSTLHPETGGMRILGETVMGDTVNLELSSTPEEPASFTMVFDFQ
jgi:hypothetical protein